MNAIAERLEIIKKEQNLSNSELAREAGVSRQAVGNWLNHDNKPTYIALKNIEKNLLYSAIWVMEGIEPKRIPKQPSIFIEQMMAFEEAGLTERAKQTILEIGETYLRTAQDKPEQ